MLSVALRTLHTEEASDDTCVVQLLSEYKTPVTTPLRHCIAKNDVPEAWQSPNDAGTAVKAETGPAQVVPLYSVPSMKLPGVPILGFVVGNAPSMHVVDELAAFPRPGNGSPHPGVHDPVFEYS